MIAQLVFDLPLELSFDYLIPTDLIPFVKIGQRVKVSFGHRRQIGFVVGLIATSDILKLKSIEALVDRDIVFNEYDLQFAKDFSGYYGCSLGEALACLLRNKQELKASLRREHKPSLSLYCCQPDSYGDKIQKIVQGVKRQYQGAKADYCQFLILVPDHFRAQTLAKQLKESVFKIGTRSMVFEADGRYDAVFMIDNEDASYRQEQSPMYDTTQVLLRRSEIFGFDVVFVGVSPSVEIMAMARDAKIKLIQDDEALSIKIVDLTNYKYIPGMLSIPLRNALESALKGQKRTLLVLNRRGSYRLTRCVDCGEILKCQHCDSPLTFSRAAKIYTCPYCSFSLPQETDCFKCHKPSWRSQGMGVEQLQTELKKIFPQAKILGLEREAKTSTKSLKILGDFDILISTQAVLRFQGQIKFSVAGFIDFDSELNRLQMRSSFNARSLVLHVASMASTTFIQARNINHYVLESFSNKSQDFYDEELQLRKELGFSPYKHWIKIAWRGKREKNVKDTALAVYNKLMDELPKSMTVTEPMADVIVRKRDQFRFNIMVHAVRIVDAMSLIKSVLAQTKRANGVIVTLQIDP